MSVLEKQIKEAEVKKKEFKNLSDEQGEIWKNEDQAIHEKIRENMEKKKIKQKEIKEILDKQMKEKEDKELADLQLSPIESRLNKNIFTTAMKILGESP